MPIHKLTDTEIKIRIVPKRLRWPAPGTTIVWTKAHACVDGLENIVRKVDLGCLEAEHDRELSAGGIARRRAGLCDQALIELSSFTPFEIAEKAIIESIDLLERRTDRDPQQAQTHQKLTEALADLQQGVAATKRMLMERCKMRAGVSV